MMERIATVIESHAGPPKALTTEEPHRPPAIEIKNNGTVSLLALRDASSSRG
jgi:hypothetical protein